MENNETPNSINEDQNELSRKFLKITNVRMFSYAYNLRVKEGDIIIGLNGEYFHSSYEDLLKALEESAYDTIISKYVEAAENMLEYVICPAVAQAAAFLLREEDNPSIQGFF